MDNSTEIINYFAQLFSISTNCTYEQAFEIIFQDKSFADFDEKVGIGKLELIREQVKFYINIIERAEAEKDNETKFMLKSLGYDQFLKAQQTTCDFPFTKYRKKQINLAQLQSISKQIYNTLSDDDLKLWILNSTQAAVDNEFSKQNKK